MVHHRERMVSRGVAADAIQPEWCHQNEGLCYLRKPSEEKEKPENQGDLLRGIVNWSGVVYLCLLDGHRQQFQ